MLGSRFLKQDQTAAAMERLGKHVSTAGDAQSRMNGVVCMGHAKEL
jgi:hypothetical protein